MTNATLEEIIKAADEGDVEAIFVLATKYRNGDEVPLDKAKAAELYRIAADKGDSYSQYDLAFMLDSGEGIPENKEEAEKYFKLSADQGDTDACLCIGGILFEKGKYAEAESYFLSAAMKGDVKAEYNLGLLYIGEYLGAPDKDKAREWFDSSANKGFAFSLSMMGSLSLNEGDLKSAESYFRKAAEQGEPTAQYNMGVLGITGKFEMEQEEALNWLSKAAQQGMEPAYQILVELSKQGDS